MTYDIRQLLMPYDSYPEMTFTQSNSVVGVVIGNTTHFQIDSSSVQIDASCTPLPNNSHNDKYGQQMFTAVPAAFGASQPSILAEFYEWRLGDYAYFSISGSSFDLGVWLPFTTDGNTYTCSLLYQTGYDAYYTIDIRRKDTGVIVSSMTFNHPQF